jgi:hypothetical protein
MADSDEELNKKLNNPVADLVTLPFQYTGTVHSGPFEKPQHTLDIQPVYPVSLGGDLKLINRVIVPVLSDPASVAGADRTSGIGDVLYEGFFSPAPSAALTWGAGPIVMLRTASDEQLGTGKWAAGPALVVLSQPGPWTIGCLVTQLWSFAGDANRPDVNQFQLQPIINYRLSARHSIGYIGTITANWEQPSSQRWTVPLGVSYSVLTHPAWTAGPVNVIAGFGRNVVRPDNAGDWYFRLQVNFVFSK